MCFAHVCVSVACMCPLPCVPTACMCRLRECRLSLAQIIWLRTEPRTRHPCVTPLQRCDHLQWSQRCDHPPWWQTTMGADQPSSMAENVGEAQRRPLQMSATGHPPLPAAGQSPPPAARPLCHLLLGTLPHLLVDRLLYAPRLRTLAPLVVLACRLYGRALVRFFKRHSVSARARCQPHRRRWIRTQCIGVGDRRRRPGRLCHCRRLRLHCRVACLGSRSACRRRLLRRGCWLGAHHAVHFGLGRFQVCLGRRGECCLGAGHVKWRLLGRCLGKRSLEAGHVR
mmetsp:Transcript_39973/g.119038  ORF Transcript_39973/g.119038 Transcript_39973/m.119038 type:complete len:283 (-) Transcript_39973:278-1126(-)